MICHIQPRKWIILVVLMVGSCLPAAVRAADSVEAYLEVDYAGSDSYNYHQGAPRKDQFFSETDSSLAFVTGTSFSIYSHHLRAMTGRLSSFGTGLSLSTGSLIGDHAFWDVAGDTAWVCGNNDADSVFTFMFDVADATLAQPFDTTTVDTSGAYGQSPVAAIAHYGNGGNKAVMIWRNPATMSVLYGTTNDNGRSWTLQGDLYAYDQVVRIDLHEFQKTAVAIIYRYYEEVAATDRHFDLFVFDTTSEQFGSREVMVTSTNSTREYNTCMDNNRGVAHLVFATFGSPSYIVHVSGAPGGTYTIDTVSTGANRTTGDYGQHYFPVVQCSDYDAQVRIGYPTWASGVCAHFYQKRWDGDAETLSSDSLEVSHGTSTLIRLPSGALNAPANWRSAALYRFKEVISGSYRDRVFLVSDPDATEYTGEPPTTVIYPRRRRSQ